MKNFKLPEISIKSFSLKSLPLQLPPQLNINLQQREKLLIAAAGVVLFVFLVLQLAVFPFINKGDNLRDEIAAKQNSLQNIRDGKAEYQLLSRNSRDMETRLNKRPKTFTLFSFIDQLAGKSGIKKNIISMQPSTANVKNSSYKISSVDMKLSAVTMEQLTAFLHGLEDPNNAVWIKRISMSKGDKKEGLLNTVLQVETYQR